MGVKAAFIGACGATLIHVLASTLLAGHRAAACKFSTRSKCAGTHIRLLVVRNASKLRTMLSDLGVSEDTMKVQLIIVEGSSRDTDVVMSLLRNEPEVIFSGITSLPKFSWNPFRPIGMVDATITGDSAAAVVEALRQLKATSAITKLPVFCPISSTGHGSVRDQPLPLIPLYLWLLPIPQADTAVLETVVRAAATEPNSALDGYVMLRPPLLTHGKKEGTKSLRVGWIWEDDVFRSTKEKELGVEVGYTISRQDLAQWMFEELVQGDVNRWKGKCVNLTY